MKMTRRLARFVVLGLFLSTSAVAAGEWKILEGSSPIDDSKTVIAIVASEEPIRTRMGRSTRPELIMRCKEGKATAYVIIDVFLKTDSIHVTSRIDAAPAVTASWDISTDYKSVFVSRSWAKANGLRKPDGWGALSGWENLVFMNRMLTAKRLVLRLTPYGANPVTMAFDVSGFGEHYPSIAEACGWVTEAEAEEMADALAPPPEAFDSQEAKQAKLDQLATLIAGTVAEELSWYPPEAIKIKKAQMGGSNTQTLDVLTQQGYISVDSTNQKRFVWLRDPRTGESIVETGAKPGKEYAKEVQQGFAQALATLRSTVPDGPFCRLGIMETENGIAYFVEPPARSGGLEAGDKIIAVAGDETLLSVESIARIRQHKPGDRVVLTVEREGTTRDLTLTCQDGHKSLRLVVDVLRAGATGEWAKCISGSLEAESLLGPSASLAFTRLQCNEAKRLLEQRAPSYADAALVYEARKRAIGESRTVPEGVDRIRTDALLGISWLRDSGFSTFADDLQKLLDPPEDPDISQASDIPEEPDDPPTQDEPSVTVSAPPSDVGGGDVTKSVPHPGGMTRTDAGACPTIADHQQFMEQMLAKNYTYELSPRCVILDPEVRVGGPFERRTVRYGDGDTEFVLIGVPDGRKLWTLASWVVFEKPRSAGAYYAQTNANVRAEPNLAGKVVFRLSRGAQVDVQTAPTTWADGYTWVSITTNDGRSGWCAQELLGDKAPAPERITKSALPDRIKSALSAKTPINSVKFRGSTLTIALEARSFEQEEFYPIVKDVCKYIIMCACSIDEIAVTNKFGGFGFVYERPDRCASLQQKSGRPLMIAIVGYTHLL